MKSTQLIAAALLSLAGVAAAAQTAAPGTNTPRIDQRQANQEQRIDQGVASGALTKRETRRLEREQAVIDKAENKVSAVMVVENRRLVGIFTERDAVFRVIAADRDVQTTRLAEVMTPEPKTVTPDESFGYVLLMMHENGFRHVPVVENGEPIGVVSARNALDPELEDFESEAQRRKQIRREPRIA